MSMGRFVVDFLQPNCFFLYALCELRGRHETMNVFLWALMAQLRLVLNCFIADGLDTMGLLRHGGGGGLRHEIFYMEEAILCAAMITGKFNYPKTSSRSCVRGVCECVCGASWHTS